MALTEETVEDKIEVVGEFKHVQVRTATIIRRDGEEISRTYHRHIIQPGDDYSGQSSDVQAVCSAVHTQAIKDAYADHIASQAD